LEVLPATHSQRHVGILGGALGIEAVRVNEMEVACCGAYQQQRRAARRCANRREQRSVLLDRTQITPVSA